MGLPLGKVVCWGLVLGGLERQKPRARSQVALGQSVEEVQGGGAGEGEQAQRQSSRVAKRKARNGKGRMAISLMGLLGFWFVWCGVEGRGRRAGGKLSCEVLVDGGVRGESESLLEGGVGLDEVPLALVVLGGKIKQPRCAFFVKGSVGGKASEGLLDGGEGAVRGESVME